MKMMQKVRRAKVKKLPQNSGLAPLFIAVLVAFVILVVLAAAGKSILTGLFHLPDDETSSTPVTLQPMQATISLNNAGSHTARAVLIKLTASDKNDVFKYGANSTNSIYFVVKNFDEDSVIVPGAVLYMQNGQWMLAADSKVAYETQGKAVYLAQQMKLGSSTTQVEFAIAEDAAYVFFNENYGIRITEDNFNVIVARQSKWQVAWDASSANPTLSSVTYTEGYVDGVLHGPREAKQGFVSPSGTTLTQASSGIVQLEYAFLN